MSATTPSSATAPTQATIYRPVDGRLRVRIPFADGNRSWFRTLNIRGVKWDKDRRCWTLPRASWDKALDGLCSRFDLVRDVRDNRVNSRELCNAKCQTASTPDCECSCGGQYHQTAVGGIHIGDSGVLVLWERGETKRTERLHHRV